jgi:enamine deaminase RidA (YjgF/YER057c/UK114 family)
MPCLPKLGPTSRGSERDGLHADASLKDAMNEALMAWVDRSNLPARAAVGAVLTPGTLVEIMVCAVK